MQKKYIYNLNVLPETKCCTIGHFLCLMFVYVHMPRVYMWRSEDNLEVSSLFLLHGFWDENSGHWAWQKVTLSSKSLHWPLLVKIFIFTGHCGTSQHLGGRGRVLCEQGLQHNETLFQNNLSFFKLCVCICGFMVVWTGA